MKTNRILALLLAFVAVLFSYDAGAATAFTTYTMGSAPTAWTNQIWKVNASDTFSNAPFAGTNYVAIPNGTLQSGNVNNTRLRNPAVDGTISFPGDSLTLQTNTDMRFKRGAFTATLPFVSQTITRFPGVGGNAGLILDGGSLNPGDDAIFPIAGSIRVQSDSLFGMGDGNIQGVNVNRGFIVQASLSGSGSLIIVNAATNFANVEVTSANNDSYTGTWIVKAGWLKGTASGSLGKGNITLDPNYVVSNGPGGLITTAGAASLTNGPVRFEVNYDLDSPGTLTVATGDAQVVLHQNLRFAKVFVDGNPIPNGTYDYATVSATFPTHVVPGGSGSISIGPATPSALAATAGDAQVRLSWTGSSGATGYVIYQSLTSGSGYTPIFTNGTGTTYTNTGLANGTAYYYVVTEINAGGESVFSNEATATPGQFAPVISTDVVDVTACNTTTASFSVVVNNTYPVVYQWYYNTNTLLVNQTNSTYSTNNVQFANAGIYSVVVTNNFGNVTSSFASLVVRALTVATGPANQTNCPGSSPTFTTVATGDGALTYTWRKGAAVVQDPNVLNSASYSLTGVTAADSGQYSVTVVGGCSTVSNSFTFVVAPAPIITVQPVNQTTPMGNGAVFSVTALTTNAGAAPLSYVWSTNGVVVTGAAASTLAISNVTLALNGMQVQVAVTNCAGGLLSSTATLTVTPVSSISFDFNTPGQFTNAPYNMFGNDWMNSTLSTVTHFGPVTLWESPTGGVGVATGSGVLDLAFGTANDQTTTLLPVNWDFSLPGKTLTISMMVKLKDPVQNASQRAIEAGFITATQYSATVAGAFSATSGNNVSWGAGVLQSTITNVVATGNWNQENPRYGLLTQTKPGNTATAVTLTPVNSPTNTAGFATNRWYLLTMQFVNVKGAAGTVTASNYTTAITMQDMGADGLTPGSILEALPATLHTNVDLVNSTTAYFAIRNFENGGIDYIDNIYINSGVSGPVSIVQQPANQTVEQGGIATFKVLVDGDGPYTYQWSKNGVPISGAGNWKYTTPQALLSDDGAQYTVTVTGSNATMVTSSSAVLSVTPKTLAVLSVGSVDGSVVGLRFNQPVTQASAEDPTHYTINGVQVLSAQLRVFDPLNAMQQLRTNQTEVLLTPASPVTTPYTVVASSVTSLSGTALGGNNTAVGAVVGLTSYDVDPQGIRFNGQVATLPGYTYSFASNQLEIISGGHDIFGNFDGFHFAYKQITGDFDLKMRVPYLDPFRTPNKAGFDARWSLDASAPHVGCYWDPMLPGRNIVEGGARTNYNQATVSWGTTTAASYPNAWLRFRRAGDTFMRYSSQNGINWLFDGQFSPVTPGGQGTPVPATLYVGVAGNCNVGGGALQQLVVGQIDNYGNFGGYPGAVIAITAQPANPASVAAGASVSISGLTATLTGGGAPTTAGEISYLWQRTNTLSGGWTNVQTAGATNNILVVGAVFGGDNGAQFRAIVSAPGALTAGGAQSVTSSVVTITVTDTAAPTISAAATFIPTNSLNTLVVTFSEFLSPGTALNKANYVVTNSAGVVFGIANVGFLNGDRRAVVITTSNNLAQGTYGVRVTGVTDLLNNAVAANTVGLFTSYGVGPLYPVVIDYYGSLATAGNLGDLTGNVKFLGNNPDWIVYSNAPNVNGYAATFPSSALGDNYGARIYSYFVPTNSTNYIFWWRADDFAQFSMNTNSTGSTNPAGKVSSGILTLNNPSYSLTNSFVTPLLTAGQPYYMELLFKEGGGGDGAAIMVTVGNTTNGLTAPAATTVAAGNLFAFPDAVASQPKALVELYTGLSANLIGANGAIDDLNITTNLNKVINGLPDRIHYEKYMGYSTNLGNTSLDNYFGRIISYFVAPSNGNYKFYIRSDDSSRFFMNTNAVNSTDPAGKVQLGQLNAFTAAYTLAGQNISLVGGQRYYMEGVWREGGGGDGMTIQVRAQSDATAVSVQELILGNMLEFPTNLDRIGPVNFNQAGSAGGIAPMNPTVSDGQSLTFIGRGLAGSPPYLGSVWFKNGVEQQANNPYWVTQPFTLADDGAVITLMVTNLWSAGYATSVVHVVADNTPPVIANAKASQYGDSVLLTFNEGVEATSANTPENYSIPGLTVLSADRDDVDRNHVSLHTTPQTPGMNYTVIVNGVKDLSSGTGNPTVNATTNFTAWGFGGVGTVYVEVFTNIPSTSVDFFFTDPRGIYNMPDISYYTNVFASGNFGANSGPLNQAENYAARITGLFMPPSNGLYRFYIRGDDGTRLYMNTNGPSPSGRVLVARNDGANSGGTLTLPSGYQTGVGLGIVGASATPPISLTNGTPYYIEALMKEGGGGDYVTLVMRSVDAATGLDTVGLPTTPAAADSLSAGFFSTTGNPDVNQLLIVSQPVTPQYLTEDDFVDLSVVATTTPASLTPYVSYQWQRSNSVAGFVNVPGATSLSFSFYVPLIDDGATYRLVASIPGQTRTVEALLHVAEDVTPVDIVSVSSLDGYTVGVQLTEPPDTGVAELPDNWAVNNYEVNVIASKLVPSDPSKVILTLDAPIAGDFYLENFYLRDRASGIHDGAPGNFTPYSYMTGAVQNVQTQMVGTASGNVAGGYNALVPSSSQTFLNGGFDVSANGFDIWNTADAFQFTYRQVSGNFDIKTRIQKLVGADQWSKAGLMARPSTNSNSRMFFMCATPMTTPIPTQASNNFFAAQYRDTDGGAPGNAQNTNAPSYPNAWVRLQRSNSVFFGFWSTNGVDWTLLLARDTATNAGGVFPDVLQVGLGTTSHDQTRGLANNAFAEYRDFYFPVGASITAQPGPSLIVTGIHQSVTFGGVVASGTGVKLQWRRDGLAISDATNATITIADTKVADSGLYTVLAYNDGGGEVSVPLQLIVTNILPVANSDTITATENMDLTFPSSVLTANDTDPEIGDPISVLSVFYPHTIATNFDQGILVGSSVYGDAHWSNNVGSAGSGAIVLNDSLAGATGVSGSFVINEITPGSKVYGFSANFNLRIGEPSAEPADGFSFNFGNDLPTGSTTLTNANTGAFAAENGVTATGFAFCIDDYRFAPYPAGGTANTSGMKIRYNNVDIAGVQCPAWTAAGGVYIPVSITLESNGRLTVIVNGTNVFGNITLPWTPMAGRFGFYGRTGGQSESHMLDDLNINFNADDTALGGRVSLTGGNITYSPPTNTVNTSDTFYYVASDGQLGGTNVGTVTVNIVANAPVVITNPTYSGGTFSGSIATVNGVSYLVKFKNDLNVSTWTLLTTIPGDGTVKTFTDSGPLPPTRFYHIEVAP